MSNMRGLIGRAVDSSDLGEKIGEGDRDRVAALAGASRLGSALWRLKYSNDPKVYKSAVLLLAKRMGWKNSDMLQRICELAIREWLLGMCIECKGAREVIVGDLRITCPSCEGIGVKRYSDRERERFVGLEARSWDRWVKKYEAVQAAMTGEDIRVNAIVSIKLERG